MGCYRAWQRRHLELSHAKWDALRIITEWLLLFQQAT